MLRLSILVVVQSSTTKPTASRAISPSSPREDFRDAVEENTACGPPSRGCGHCARVAAGSSAAPCMRAHSSHPPATRPLARRCRWCGPWVCLRVPKPFARRDPNRAEPTCLGARWQVRSCKRSIRSARHGRDSQDRYLVRPPHLMWEPSFWCSGTRLLTKPERRLAIAQPASRCALGAQRTSNTYAPTVGFGIPRMPATAAIVKGPTQLPSCSVLNSLTRPAPHPAWNQLL